jgi:hypothetical protein
VFEHLGQAWWRGVLEIRSVVLGREACQSLLKLPQEPGLTEDKKYQDKKYQDDVLLQWESGKTT